MVAGISRRRAMNDEVKWHAEVSLQVSEATDGLHLCVGMSLSLCAAPFSQARWVALGEVTSCATVRSDFDLWVPRTLVTP